MSEITEKSSKFRQAGTNKYNLDIKRPTFPHNKALGDRDKEKRHFKW